MDKIELISKVSEDNYTNYLTDKYDLQVTSEHKTIIPMIDENELNSFNWNIGLICGNSGSGKSTILRNLVNFKDIVPTYDMNKSIISQFPNLSEEEVCDLLSSVGLSSVPVWLHKPNELSNGERARLDICWLLANSKDKTIFCDEFTSVVNRQCAQSLSFALQRYVRKNNLQIILASCHFDIIEWLNPDWIFNLNKQNDGNVEIEHLVYTDDNNYCTYDNTNKDNVLTKKYDVQ
jgi:ABC-type ATPase with predicted acetyltransferase domain